MVGEAAGQVVCQLRQTLSLALLHVPDQFARYVRHALVQHAGILTGLAPDGARGFVDGVDYGRRVVWRRCGHGRGHDMSVTLQLCVEPLNHPVAVVALYLLLTD